MMPPKGNEARAAAEAELNALIHRTRTDPRLAEWLRAAEAEPLDDVARANLREIRRDWRDANALPESLVEARTLAGARCEHAWRSQRPANDWRGFLENFREVVRLAREEARLLAEETGLARYDALMDRYEPGVRAADIERIFGDLKQWLPQLTTRVQAKQRDEKITTPTGTFPVAAQRCDESRRDEAAGFRFRSRAAGRERAPLQRRSPGGRAPDHALPRRRFRAKPAGDDTRDRSRALRAEPAPRMAGAADRRGAFVRHTRKPEPVIRDAARPEPRLRRAARPDAGRPFREPAGVPGGQPVLAVYTRQAGLHPRASRRGNLPGSRRSSASRSSAR